MQFQKHIIFFLPVTLLLTFSAGAQIIESSHAQFVKLNLQERIEAETIPDSYLIREKAEKWNPNETAIVICDMWDKHWCKGASARTAEMAPRMNQMISVARKKGILIVHAPGGCMEFYSDHPARENALKYFDSGKVEKISTKKLVTEKNAQWPIDDSDGGCDCNPECKQHHPWTKEIDIIQIKENDLITDSGIELLSYLKATGIKNVILMGVHTNMCIIHRPYGLRSMIHSGFNTVLVRDLTDAMYDSKQWPYVSHFDGTRLMIGYIEKYICPTFASSDFTKETEFNFKDDKKIKTK